MKKGLSVFLVLMSLALSVFAHGEHGQSQYGGIFGEAGVFQAELVVSDARVLVYLTEHGQPLASQGARAKLTILVAGKPQELKLVPAGDNRLEAPLSSKLASGSKLVASISLADKRSGNVRFSLP